MSVTRPDLSNRILSAACYLGLAPLARLWRARSGPFVQHHQRQAMAALFCGFLLLTTVFGLFELGLSAFFILFPKVEESMTEHWGWLGEYAGYALWLPMLALAAVWLTLLGLALAGSTWPIPGLRALSDRAWVVRGTFCANAVAWLLLPCLLVFGLYAVSLTQRSREGAAVYFLYDEGIPVPRWFYAMGLSRIARQAEHNWGRCCTVLDRLTQQTLQTALASGRVVILATHGADGYAGTYYTPETLIVGPASLGATDERGRSRFLQTSILPYNWESWNRLHEGKWDRWENVPVGSQVELVYLFACQGGKRAPEWREHLAPARVISYNRLSAVWDHAWWFAFSGPSQVEGLP